ncbi:MAG: SCP2 sterol-binding domain-containing protein [Porcipelethomonas sp.]
MTYEEIVAKAKEEFGSADVSNYEGHLALQFNVTGEGEGIFYAEILDGKLYIEPFDYKDNDAVLTADGSDLLSLFSGALDPAAAFESGKLTVTGDIAKALSIQPIIENNKKAAKKTTKKATAKTAEKPAKTAAKTTKTAAKTTAKTTKAAAKKDETPAIIGLAEPKKAPAKAAAPKTAAKKATAKTTAKESTKAAKTAPKTTAKKG